MYTPTGRGVAWWDPARVNPSAKFRMHAKSHVSKGKGLTFEGRHYHHNFHRKNMHDHCTFSHVTWVRVVFVLTQTKYNFSYYYVEYLKKKKKKKIIIHRDL